MTPEIARPKFRIAAVAVFVLSAFVGACGDLTGVPASLNTVTDSTNVYALNGSPSVAPTALHVFSGTLLPVTSSFVFDVAFDIDAGGNALMSEIEALIGRYAPFSEQREQFALALYGTSETLKVDGEGRVMLTDTLKPHAIALPAPSCAEQLTGVVPTAKADPGGGVQVTAVAFLQLPAGDGSA